MRVRLTARARRALNWRSVMRWSGQRGKTMLNRSFLDLSGSKGFLVLYSCLIRDTGTMETDCCSMFQHSTSASDLASVPGTELDALAFFARALRFPTRLLVSIIWCPLIGRVLTADLDKRETKALLTVCPCVQSSLCPSACRSILGPSPVVFPAYRLSTVSKSCLLKAAWYLPRPIAASTRVGCVALLNLQADVY